MRQRQIDPWHGIERPVEKSHKKKEKSNQVTKNLIA